MRLAAWRKTAGLTQTQLAEKLGVSQPYVSQIERSRDPLVPGPAIVIEIYVLSGGLVQPNDFYALPAVQKPRMQAA